MRFLADKSCDFAVVTALRAARHDISAVVELEPGAEDAVVLALCVSLEEEVHSKLYVGRGQARRRPKLEIRCRSVPAFVQRRTSPHIIRPRQ